MLAENKIWRAERRRRKKNDEGKAEWDEKWEAGRKKMPYLSGCLSFEWICNKLQWHSRPRDGVVTRIYQRIHMPFNVSRPEFAGIQIFRMLDPRHMLKPEMHKRTACVSERQQRCGCTKFTSIVWLIWFWLHAEKKSTTSESRAREKNATHESVGKGRNLCADCRVASK